MIAYVKLWTTIYNDTWYLSMNSAGRGIWLGLIVWAKLVGDTGIVTYPSWVAVGSALGCDGKTARKFLGKFHENGKVILKTENSAIIIEIVNYQSYQALKDDKAWREARKNPGKFPTNNNKNNNNNSNSNRNVTSYDPNKFIHQKTHKYNHDKSPYENLMEWDKSKECDDMINEFAATPGYELDWVKSEFLETFVPWVKIESEKAKESLMNNYSGSWKSMFFAWLRRAKKSVQRDQFYSKR